MQILKMFIIKINETQFAEEFFKNEKNFLFILKKHIHVVLKI
jgi:hypothetical protein